MSASSMKTPGNGEPPQDDLAGPGEEEKDGDADDLRVSRVQALWRGKKVRREIRSVLPIVQFSTMIYYVSEEERDAMIEIVRLEPEYVLASRQNGSFSIFVLTNYATSISMSLQTLPFIRNFHICHLVITIVHNFVDRSFVRIFMD